VTSALNPHWRTPQGDATRAAILRVAVDLASTEGLEGLTIGRLAEALSMSKSGLIGHFGSKEQLQLATVERAREIFVEEVVAKGLAAPSGIAQLRVICAAWLDYATHETFRGGCFFSAASAEFDGRPGLVRDRIREVMQEWLSGLEGLIREAQNRGELAATVEPAQLAFELNALEMAANWAFQLFGDKEAISRAKKAIEERLRAVTTSKGRAPVKEPRRRRGV
jgi:AcrR family transcriptional regulator